MRAKTKLMMRLSTIVSMIILTITSCTKNTDISSTTINEPLEKSNTATADVAPTYKADAAKKGMGASNASSYVNNLAVANMNLSWNYSWGPTRDWTSLSNTNFIPMIWWGNQVNTNTLNDLKTEINAGRAAKILLSFNEPDNPKQANMSVADAYNYYKTCYNSLKGISGMTFVSPVATESQAYKVSGKWLNDFMVKINTADNGAYKGSVDRIALHWYDWEDQNLPSSPTTMSGYTDAQLEQAAINCSERLVAYLNRMYKDYGKYIYLTEFNGNVRRQNIKFQKYFMYHACYKMDQLSFVLRYAFFFEENFRGWNANTGALTDLGLEWKNR